MTNILTDFRGRIVRHSLHRATQLYAGMVQWLSIQVSLMLSHIDQYDVGSIPVEVTYFWLHLPLVAILFYFLIH